MLHPAFIELHAGLQQQGPGSPASTARAFASVGELPAGARILDMGCGTGRQTLDLARLAPTARIEALDLLPEFVAEVERRVAQDGLSERVRARRMSMVDSSLADPPADLIWSEGAIYNVGLEAGLRAWRRFLAPNGAVALTELSWLSDEPPAEPADFWAKAYPGMGSRETNLAMMQSLGYEVLDCFVLPDEDWLERYYEPLDRRQAELAEKYRDDPSAIEALGEHRQELDLFRRFSSAYGYVFYVLRVDRPA